MEKAPVSATVCIMLVLPPSPIRSVLSGLGCVALLSGVPEALRLGPAVWVPYGVLAVVLGATWRRRTRAASAASRRAMPVGVRLARSAQEPSALASAPDVRDHGGTRGFWSRMKLWVGGVGFVASGLWWLLLGALLFMPDPAPALDGLFTSNFLPLMTVSLLLTLLFVVILRSGLRGPSDPLAANQRAPAWLGEQPAPRSAARAGASRDSHKKSHLRLVRDTP